MVGKQATKPSGSQVSSSELSDPPNIRSDEEYREIEVKFAMPPTPIPHSQESTADDSIAVLPADNNSSSSRSKRSTRNHRPVRYSESNDELDAAAEETLETSHKRAQAKRSNTSDSPDSAAKNPPPKRARPTPRTRKSKWDPKYVTENEKSPLVNIDLRSLLLQPAAWDCLTAEDKKEILALMPDKTHILSSGTPDARPDFQSLRNDDNFRHDCDQYVANLSNGMHDPTWLKDAWIAHGRRNAGQFDEFHLRKLELDWGATILDQYKPAHLRSQQDGEPSTSTGQPTSNQAAESQGQRENFTSQRFSVNANISGKAGKGKGAAARRRSGKVGKVAGAMSMDGGGDSIEVATDGADDVSDVHHDARTEPLPTGDAVDVKKENDTQVDKGCSSDRDGKGTVSAKPNGADDGGSKSENVSESSSIKTLKDIDMPEG